MPMTPAELLAKAQERLHQSTDEDYIRAAQACQGPPGCNEFPDWGPRRQLTHEEWEEHERTQLKLKIALALFNDFEKRKK
jgi:hypothetical protein